MEMVTINEQNLMVGAKVIEKKTNNELLVSEINEGKYVLSNGKVYSFSTMKRNYKVLIVEPVVEPVVTTPVEPKKAIRKKKISDEQYIQIAEDFLKGVYKTKKEIALKYGVDTATISDIFTNYCRKSCFKQVQELKEKYNYKK